MKRIMQLLTAVLFITVSFNVQAQNKDVQTTTFECNLSCHSCEMKIMKNIPYEKGVKGVKVYLDKKEVTVSYKPSKNNDEQIKKALEKMGYTVAIKPSEKEKKEE